MEECMVWTDEMSLGVPSMDTAHRDFIEQVARLAEVSDDGFPQAYADLIKAVERDFYAEEKLMDEVNFPANNSHMEQHARVLSALHHANSQVMMGDVAAGRKVAELMLQWFSFHLSTMDTALAIAYELAHSSRESVAV